MTLRAATLAVTGSTGRLGGRVARRLAAAGIAQRLVVRDASRAPALAACSVVVAAYDDAVAARAALAGVSTLFMVSGAEHPERVAQHRSFIDAARDAGVAHIVYTSFYGASPDATFTLARDHWAAEEHIRASGMAHTILRDNLYADFIPLMTDEHGVIRGPAGDGRVAAVAIDDVADVASVVLQRPGQHAGARYDLTGPAALTLAEAADILSTAGRRVRYVPETLDEAYASRAGYGAPRWQVDAWVSTYTAIASGELAGVTDDVPRLTGHPATSLADLVARARSGPNPGATG
jgi:uncharacterized protein YbjT (DUF2867 family)